MNTDMCMNTDMLCMNTDMLCMNIGMMCMNIGMLCMKIGMLCMNIDMLRMNIDMLCRNIGMLCMYVGIVSSINAIDMLEILCMLNLTQITMPFLRHPSDLPMHIHYHQLLSTTFPDKFNQSSIQKPVLHQRVNNPV